LWQKNEAPAEHEHYTAVPYIDDMAGALAVADLMICRSGAMTVAEVSAAGLPALYVPLPHGNGEQALNSRALVESGAAVQVPDAELTSERLVAEVRAILDHPETLTAMRTAADASTAGEVAAIIADRIAQRVAAENRG
ncbi:UDP-N-acetylglucosamine--N-acetylmuramyl-(pentapeptide) pyrophosphoryl-undecaprenol N-acetylglucosamine transferase, partial [Corynebacterium aurimucosum]